MAKGANKIEEIVNPTQNQFTSRTIYLKGNLEEYFPKIFIKQLI